VAWRLSRGLLRASRIANGRVRRQLELARPDLVSRELPNHRVAAKVPSLLRRRFQDRVPHWLGQVADDQWSCAGVIGSTLAIVPTRRGRQAARLWPLRQTATRSSFP